jgi:leader peptidase (prepilin peptidase)/N-methyltransferase
MAADFGDAGLLLLALLGLLVGSFLNVLIYRLPKMMELQWAAELAQASEQNSAPAVPFNLWVPRSTCPHCGTAIASTPNCSNRSATSTATIVV